MRRLLKPEYLEEIEGDLAELFEEDLSEGSPQRARRRYTWEVVKLLRPSLLKGALFNQKLNAMSYLKHNLVLTYRTFFRHRGSFLINLLGLSTGLACALLIYLWVGSERQMERFHPQGANLYITRLNLTQPDGISTQVLSPGRMLIEHIADEIPEVEKAVLSTDPNWWVSFSVETEQKNIRTIGKYVSADYFELFFHLTQGEPHQALADRNSVVISESLASQLFPNESNYLGKEVDWIDSEGKQRAIVKGVFHKPESSTDPFEIAVPYSYYGDILAEKEWGQVFDGVTYMRLYPDADFSHADRKVREYLKEKDPELPVELFLTPFGDEYLYGDFEAGVNTGGRIALVQLFSWIATFILVVACINFMNLSTARASRRAKEVGVKKAIGARRYTLIFQYLTESMVMSFVSMVLALVLVYLFLPSFNDITDKNLSLHISSQLWLGIIVIIVFTGLLAGSYPALYLSSFQPIKVLKGKVTGLLGEVWVRKGLVVFQYGISMVLIVAVLVLNQQINFILNKDLGYEKEQVVLFNNDGEIAQNLPTFTEQMAKIPGVEAVSGTTMSLLENHITHEIGWDGKTTETTKFTIFSSYYDFIETLGVPVLEGRTFQRGIPQDEQSIILNQAAVEAMKMEQPIGELVTLWGQEWTVIGVVQDFHFRSLYNEVSPLFFVLSDKYLSSMVARLRKGTERETLAELSEYYGTFNPGYAFEYNFLDDAYQAHYASEQRAAVLSNYFAGIAILISCLGLLGLAAFTAERRSKELGVRKVLGASVWSLVRLLSRDFMRLVGLAVLIGLPISFLLARNWLAGFAYRVSLPWWVFAVAGLSALAVSWLAIGGQTFKAARINPSKFLRQE